jgi:hypothetical protein
MQYSEMFYQPKRVADPPNKVIKFGYVNHSISHPQVTDEKSKRRWTPPVHPTKDLVYITKEEKHTSRASNKSGSGVVMRNGSSRRSSGQDNKSRSQERPASLMSDDMQKLKDEYIRSKSETRVQKNKNHSNLERHMHSSNVHNDKDIMTDEQQSGSINWSVAQLRNHFAEDKLHKQKCNQNTRANNETNPHFYSPGSQPPAPASQHRGGRSSGAPWHSKTQKTHSRTVLEHTNPNADEAYV